MPGFEEAGGLKGPGDDFMSNPTGDMQLAADYLNKAKAEGVPVTNGKYAGGQTFLMVGDSDGVGADRPPRWPRRTSRSWASR